MRRCITIASILLLIALALPAMAAIEIIMDQRDAVFSGSWTLANSATDKYSSEYRYATVSSSGTGYAQYKPNIPVTASDWRVYVWYPTITSQTSSVRYTTVHAGGSTNVNKSQTSSRGTWVLIGTYTMNAGTDNYLRVTNYGTSGGRVAADAVRFYSPTAVDPTGPAISSVTSVPGTSSVAINWTTNEPCTSQVDYGPTASYGQQTTLDRTMTTDHQVIITGLNRSDTYHFRVRSTDGGSNTATSGDFAFTTLAANVPELRGVWLYTWGSSMLSASQITDAVDTAFNSNYNVLIPEIRKAGDAYYDSAYEPRATNIIDPPPFDPLQDMITKAHAKGMEVHGWLVTYRIWNTDFGTPPSYHIWAQHPEYVMKTNTGATAEGANRNLDPGIPAVQDYIAKILVDMITKYDLDGLNFDYIRYPSEMWGYNEISVARFTEEYGYAPPYTKPSVGSPDWPKWLAWSEFRRQQVTDLVKKCYLEVTWRKPHIKMCVDTVGWTAGNPNTDYTTTRQYSEVFQNAKSWMEQGIVDVNRLMNYKREYDSVQAADFRVWNTFLKTMQDTTGRHSVCGPGVYLNYTQDSMTQLAQARAAGLSGLCTYAYHATNVGGDSNSYFYDTIRTQLFPEPAPIPDMPWKDNPTTGTVFGTVTDASHPNDPVYKDWVYKAQVTLTGPYPSADTQVTYTDATGTYGFLGLTPGVYSVTVFKPGFAVRTYSAQVVQAGDIVREDFDLGYTTVTSPSSATEPGSNWFSLPLEPVNPDPAAVLPGIRLDSMLYRWDNATQSQVVYDDFATFLFGDMNVQDGYDLYLEAPYTISYQAYADSPAMRSISLPSAGSALIGCPGLRTANWENVLVTKDGITVDMRTASKVHNWLSSTAFWWNPDEQSQYDVALPEDWPAGGTALQPWHGYWVSTYTDGLTLTIRSDRE